MSDTLIPDVVFNDNNSQRTPCVLVLDGSSSMFGEPIRQLNEGLKLLEQALKEDASTAMRVQLLVIRAGNHDQAEILTDWVDAMDFNAPEVFANGTTPLGAAMNLALDKIEDQKAAYDANGISSTRPWIILISDGAPTDFDWETVADRCRHAEQNRKVVIFPIGVEGATFETLNQFSNKGAKKLKGLQFRELFVWLSRSMATVSVSSPGEKVQLPATDWSEVEV
ncbi:vWA domain-containing protein [Hahella sp. NBU794]|uniref:vWA domain-containing protein n=1 Tax=Hahella sp. NBU794 TaxID=3422590 RepID=UPI003D6F9E3F